MTKINGPKIVRRSLGVSDPGKKYDEILQRQEALTEQIKENGEESYQHLFVKDSKKKGAGFWFLIFLIGISLLALINSLPINWMALLPGGD